MDALNLPVPCCPISESNGYGTYGERLRIVHARISGRYARATLSNANSSLMSPPVSGSDNARMVAGLRNQIFLTAAISDRRTLWGGVGTGGTGGYGGYTRKNGHWLHLAVTPADEQERAQVVALTEQMRPAANDTVKVVFVDHRNAEKTVISSAAGMRWA